MSVSEFIKGLVTVFKWEGQLVDKDGEVYIAETEDSLRAKGYIPEGVTEEYVVGEDGLRVLKLYWGGSEYEYGIAHKYPLNGIQYIKWEEGYIRAIREPVLSIVENFLSNPKRWKLEAIYSGDEFEKEMHSLWPEHRNVLYKLTDKETGVVFKCINGDTKSEYESRLTYDEVKWAAEKVKAYYTKRNARAKALRAKRSRDKLMKLYVKGGSNGQEA